MSTTWNPSDKTSGITLGTSNTRAQSSATGQQAVRATTSHSSGKWYFEIKLAAVSSSFTAGLANSTFALADALGTDDNGIAYYPTHLTCIFNGTTEFSNSSHSDVNGFFLGVAVDVTNQLVWFTSSEMQSVYGSGAWNDNTTANPATGTGGISISSLSGAVFPIFSTDNDGDVAYLNTSGSFQFAVPSGFSAWDSSTVTCSLAAFVATGGIASLTPCDRASWSVGGQALVMNVRDGASTGTAGAVGDGSTDDSPAIAKVFDAAITAAASGYRPIIVFPPGQYYLNSTSLPLLSKCNAAIIGAGSHSTYLIVGSGYPAGDVLSFSENWMGNSYASPGFLPNTDGAGTKISGLSILGNTGNTNVVNGVMFYDRNDHVLIDDVQCYYLKGRAFGFGGFEKNQTLSFMRESSIFRIKAWGCGSSTVPAIELNSVGTGDSTNQLQFHGVDVLNSAGVGLSVHASNNSKGIDNIRFFGLRAESNGADQVQIGNTSDSSGAANSIYIYGFIGNAAPSGYTTLRITGSASVQPNWIHVEGDISSGNEGINVDFGQNITLSFSRIGTTGTGITVGPSTGIGKYINIDTAGMEPQPAYSIDPTSTSLVRWYGMSSSAPA